MSELKIGNILNVGLLLGACGVTFHLANKGNRERLEAMQQKDSPISTEENPFVTDLKIKYERVKKEEAAWEVKIANMKLERDQFMKSFKADKDCSYDIEYAQAVSSAKTILETCKRSLQDLKTQNERVQEGINSGLIRPDVQKMIDTMEAAHKLEMEQI